LRTTNIKYKKEKKKDYNISREGSSYLRKIKSASTLRNKPNLRKIKSASTQRNKLKNIEEMRNIY